MMEDNEQKIELTKPIKIELTAAQILSVIASLEYTRKALKKKDDELAAESLFMGELGFVIRYQPDFSNKMAIEETYEIHHILVEAYHNLNKEELDKETKL